MNLPPLGLHRPAPGLGVSLWVLLGAASLAQSGAEPPERLTLGSAIEGVITDADAVVTAPLLEETRGPGPTLGQRFELAVEEGGVHTLRLGSWSFDAYLILRDEAGRVLAENDEGPVAMHAELVTPPLEAGRLYRVDACALDGYRGPFWLSLERGAPPELTYEEWVAANLANLAERAAAIEAMAGPSTVHLARALETLGLARQEHGDYAGAGRPLQRSLAIYEELEGPESLQTSMSLANLGELALDLQDFGTARAHHERSLAIRERLLGPEDLAVAASLFGLGAALEGLGDYAAARRSLERALAIQRVVDPAGHPRTATTLNNLGSLLNKMGELEVARAHLDESVAIGRRHPEDAQLAISLGNLGNLLHDLGELPEARLHLDEALAIFEREVGPDHPYTATALNNLALVLHTQGDLETAARTYRRVLALDEALYGREHPGTGTTLNNLGTVLLEQKELDEAQALFEREHALNLELLGERHPFTGRSLVSLAEVHRARDRADQARASYEEALSIWESAYGPTHFLCAGLRANLGRLALGLGEAGEAEARLSTALEVLDRSLGPRHTQTADVASDLVLFFLREGRLEAARALLDRHAPAWGSELAQGVAGLTEAESFGFLAQSRMFLELELAWAEAVGVSAHARGYASVLGWKGQATRQLVASRAQLQRALEPEQRALVEGLRNHQVQLSRLLTAEAGSVAPGAVDELLAGRNALELELARSLAPTTERQASPAEIVAALPAGAALVDFLVQRVADGLGDERAPDHLVAWVLRAAPDGRPSIRRFDLGPAAAVHERVQAFLEELVSHRGAAPTRPGEASPGESLREVLWDPLAAALAGVDTLFLSPDSFLGTLPFEVLPLADGGFLVEEVGLVYLQDPAALVGEREPPPRPYPSLLAVGDVDFRQRSEWSPDEVDTLAAGAVALAPGTAPLRGSFTDYWGPLAATAYESDVVEALHEDAWGEEGERLLLQGAEPSEERLKHELPRHSVLHLATHGFFQPEGTPSMWESALNEAGKRELRLSEEAAYLVGKHPGLLSGLVCAGANRPRQGGEGGDDGYLTAEEVGWLDLSGAELVVLSACETGLGRARSGEGLIGLRRAFQIAGAKTVVSSLWSVKDDSTAELMRDFYKNLFLKGMGRHEALRSAQLAMLQRNRMEHGEALPSTWGAFVLSGEWR